ncbi:hypothetical protein ScPMuIL_011948 [Solemya velum]
MGMEYRVAQSEVRTILNKLPPVFLSTFMLWLDQKVVEFKAFGQVQHNEEDGWYCFPTWCEEPIKSQKHSRHVGESPACSPVQSWQRVRQQRIQQSSTLNAAESPTKKRKLSILNESDSGNFPVILSVAGSVEDTEVSNDVDLITDDSVSSGKDGRGVSASHEVVVVRRSDDSESIQSSSRISNAGALSEIDNEIGNRLLDEDSRDADRESGLCEDSFSSDKGRGSIRIKEEPQGVGSAERTSRIVSTSGYAPVSAAVVEEPEDLSSVPATHSLSITLPASSSSSSVTVHSKPGPSGVCLASHTTVSTLPHSGLQTVTRCDQSTLVNDDESCDIKQEPPDDNYFAASGNNGEYSWLNESSAADSVPGHPSMYLDPETVSNMSDNQGQGTMNCLPLPLPSKPLVFVRNREARKLVALYVRSLVQKPRVGWGVECRRPLFWPVDVPWMKNMYHLSTDHLRSVMWHCIFYCGYVPEMYYQGGSIAKLPSDQFSMKVSATHDKDQENIIQTGAVETSP